MADPTSVNGQITDSVTQSNTKVLGESPAAAMGSLYQTVGNSVAMAASNAVYAQQQANVTSQAAATHGVSLLTSIDNDDNTNYSNFQNLKLKTKSRRYQKIK